MTPYLNPQTYAHQRFNAFLCRTSVLIEQSFGILKRRFSCLQGILRTTPEQAVGYVVACVILHNLGIQTGDVMDRVDQPMDAFDETAHQVHFENLEIQVEKWLFEEINRCVIFDIPPILSL